ncbi:2-oxoglutarate and iron-dependent oxygenase JMJD4 isoform X3 [Perognathus longimembris pacificus]|uniref:2-oxoglutarate and iron-dependent oxygenase JMJD4 isoform X3 n=1 Tax=Perognathus longimembris pacificus TaxID=214514 RepID=UPI00201A1B98|nr:2-oxoglutarate and iron-dependent oxygenase JMJD4 isoform X3 [Perognathus longimembris pacificus]
MDRETRAFAERHFRSLPGRVLGGGGGGEPARSRVAFIQAPASFSYADFVKGFLLPNLPCVFSSAFTEGWGSRRRWVTPEGKPDFEYLLDKYGDVIVPVANCGVQEYNSNPKECMSFREYISYWKEYIQQGYSSPRGCLYLKDWHLCSWSVNICGRKKWLLFPPGQEEPLRDLHGSLPYDVTAPSLLDAHLYPRLQHSSPPLEVMQEAGEMVFVPSGWHHQVYNLDDTISINHNWVNGCNLFNMWHFLQQELQAVQREISEWKDSMPNWHHHCQVIMKSCSGINFEEFYHFLKIIAEKRLLALGQGPEEVFRTCTGLGLGYQQAAFDVSRLVEVLTSVITHPDFQRVDTSTFSPQPEELLGQLKDAMAAAEAL